MARAEEIINPQKMTVREKTRCMDDEKYGGIINEPFRVRR